MFDPTELDYQEVNPPEPNQDSAASEMRTCFRVFWRGIHLWNITRELAVDEKTLLPQWHVYAVRGLPHGFHHVKCEHLHLVKTWVNMHTERLIKFARALHFSPKSSKSQKTKSTTTNSETTIL